jgi:hypothetical protein
MAIAMMAVIHDGGSGTDPIVNRTEPPFSSMRAVFGPKAIEDVAPGAAVGLTE